MFEFTVETIAGATGASVVAGDPARICRGCFIDSRLVERDGLFVAFSGERVDGNDFAPQAVSAGAAAVVLTRTPEDTLLEQAEAAGCAVLVADDAQEFLLLLAHVYRAELACTVVGVTGSIGKTTTKDFLAALLGARFRVWATKGNYNNLIGLPLSILSAPRDTQVLVLEMGMNARGEIERLAACAEPSLAVITKVGTSHIGMLGSRENIARAKAEIVSGMRPVPSRSEAGVPGTAPVLVLSGEDDFTPFIRDEFALPAAVEVVLAGTGADDEVRASNIELDVEGHPSFDLLLASGESARITLAVTGAQSVSNAVLAAALAERLGIDAATMEAAFKRLAITGRRQELRRAACGARVIDDTYNASPESTAAALDLLEMLPVSGRRIAVLGEIGELGEEGPRLHALVGSYAAAKKPDLLVCVGTACAEEMAAAARLMGMPARSVAIAGDTERATEFVRQSLRPDDTLLVKGSRFLGLDRLVEEVC